MLPARMTMFCIVSLRCSSEGPSLRRDPAKAVGRLLQLPPLLQLAPKAPGGAGSRACAATRSGAAGVAGGNRTDLGDQSGGGDGAFESRSETHSTLHRLYRKQRPARPPAPQHSAQHPHTCCCHRPRLRLPQEGRVLRDGNKAAIGSRTRNGSALPRRPLAKGRSSVIAQGDNEGARGCTPGTDC